MNSDSYPFPKSWATSGSDVSLDASSASPESRIPYAEISTLKPERLYFLLTGHHPLSPALPSKPPPDAIPIALGNHLSSRVPKRMRLDPVTTAKGRSTGTIWDEEAEMCFLLCLAHVPLIERHKVIFFGKPCGRNEIIALIVSLATGSLFTRKQISSHSQVLRNKKTLHPAIKELLSTSNDSGDDDRDGGNGSAVTMQFDTILYALMRVPLSVDLASAQKPAWLLTEEGRAASVTKGKVGSGRQERRPPHGLRSQPLRNGQIQRKDSIARGQPHEVTREVKRYVRYEHDSDRVYSDPPYLPVGPDRHRAGGIQTCTSHQPLGRPALRQHGARTMSDILPYSLCVSARTLTGSWVLSDKKLSDAVILSGVLASEDIPLLANLFDGFHMEAQTSGPAAIHLNIPLSLAPDEPSRVSQLKGIVDVAFDLVLLSSHQPAGHLYVITQGGFNTTTYFTSTLAMAAAPKRPGMEGYQIRTATSTSVFNDMMRASRELQDVILPHMWLKQRILVLPTDSGAPLFPVDAGFLGKVGKTAIVLLYTFVLDPGLP